MIPALRQWIAIPSFSLPQADSSFIDFSSVATGTAFTPGVLCSIDNPTPKDPPGTSISAWKLRAYQEGMLEGLREDVRSQASPWLGLSSPMQTGKSLLTGPIIHMLRQELGKDARILVLTSGRVVTAQVMDDLLGGFPATDVGRYDGLVKEPRQITVASTLSLVRNLDLFPSGPKTAVILDEAYSTQSPSVGRILEHFGLAIRRSKENGGELAPAAGNGVVIGFSGTGAGLDGYRISGRLSLLEAMEAGWIRHMRGERLPVQIESQRMTGTGGEKMVWWRPTRANAEFLAEIFDAKIHSHARKSLVFVPTIRHGRLLQKALDARHGKGFARFVHSGADMDEQRVSAELHRWREKGGALISVRMISRGFRATGADAVFHTYQTDSLELFGQRTGRAWGVPDEIAPPDLYVLETAWGFPGRFANLPRLAGLVDYPKEVFETRSLRGSYRELEAKNEQKRRRAEKIRQGKISPLFARIPLSHEWQRTFSGILEKNGGIAGIVKKTGLKPETVAAFELGVIPTRLVQIERLRDFLGGKWAAQELWVGLWRRAIEEIGERQEEVEEKVSQALLDWSSRVEWTETVIPLSDLAASLEEEVLGRLFTKGVGPQPLIEKLVQETRDQVFAEMDEGELRKMIHDTIREYQTTLEGRRLDIFRRRILSDEPTYSRVLADAYEVTLDRIRQIAEKMIRDVEENLYLRLIQTLNRPAESEPLTLAHKLFFVEVTSLPFEKNVKKTLQNLNIKYLGELLRKTRKELLEAKGFGSKRLEKIEDALDRLGLSLGMAVSLEPVPDG